MRLTVMSLQASSSASPPEAGLVLDVRCLPNPLLCSGTEAQDRVWMREVVDFVMGHPGGAQELLQRSTEIVSGVRPAALRQGKAKAS
ncbi:MAG: hypothetical protein ACLVES_02845 [Faecalibacterium prausnitzii]